MTPINLRRLEFELRRIRRIPLPTLAGKVATKFLGLGLGLALLPVTALLHLAGYRHVTIFTDRIGHLALEPDCLLKEQALGHIPNRKWIMLAPPGRVANEHLLTYWAPHFLIVRSQAVCFLIACMSRWGLLRYDISHYARVQGRAQESFRIYSTWADRSPMLILNADDCIWRKSALQWLGLPEGAWFVCVHAREGGYSPTDEVLHAHRNSDIENLIPAMKYIVASGGWVVRVGDSSMKPLPTMSNVIDYAHHPLKSPRLDVILGASCKFILGSTSGVCFISTLFGISAAIANMVPPADLWYGPRDLTIPKRIWSETRQRLLSLEESIHYPQGCFRYSSQYQEAGLQLIENSPEDIGELVKEMINRLSGKEFDLPDDVLTRSMYKTSLDERYTSFYSCSRLGVGFFRKHSQPIVNRDNS
jgi:putative glycosyltransferase (TIGR04372 family)